MQYRSIQVFTRTYSITMNNGIVTKESSKLFLCPSASSFEDVKGTQLPIFIYCMYAHILNVHIKMWKHIFTKTILSYKSAQSDHALKLPMRHDCSILFSTFTKWRFSKRSMVGRSNLHLIMWSCENVTRKEDGVYLLLPLFFFLQKQWLLFFIWYEKCKCI